MEGGNESQANGLDQTFTRTIEELCQNKERHTCTQNTRQDQKGNSLTYFIRSTKYTELRDGIERNQRKNHMSYRKTHQSNSSFFDGNAKGQKSLGHCTPSFMVPQTPTRWLPPGKLSGIVEGKRKTSHNIKRLKSCMPIKPIPQRILETILWTKGRDSRAKKL